jgi:hypothetical protein
MMNPFGAIAIKNFAVLWLLYVLHVCALAFKENGLWMENFRTIDNASCLGE